MMMTTTAKMMIVLILLLSTTSQSFPMAKQNCTADCGGITIPYPLGTTPNCSLNPNFWVTCNKTDNPPKLFLYNTSSQIIDISLDGQMTMMQPIGRICYGGSSNDVTSYNFPNIQFPMGLTYNSTANKFTTLGCNADADMIAQGYNMAQTIVGCTEHPCPAAGHVEVDPCTNVGCCQVSIPGDISAFTMNLVASNNTPIEYFENSCTYAFLVEETAFRSSSKNLTGLLNLQELPVVVDWVVGWGTTCDEAKKDTSSYACVSSFSACHEIGGAAAGYRCRCKEGYEGNPYLINGCQDIDECADASLNNCFKKEYCTNTAGNYRCSCPEGYSGNGFRNGHDDECTKNHTEKKHEPLSIVILIGIGVIITILAVAYFIHKAVKRISEKKLKRRYYVKNGGIYLEDKLSKMGSSSPYLVKIYSYSDLENATRNFDSSMVIGEGGFGMVYRGILPDNSVVAIKRSKTVDSKQPDQFINEVFVLSQVNHKNIVRILGCCLETEIPLMVYEFIENGTLSSHIHNEEKAPLIKWNMRLKVAADTAAVLSYMHSCAASTPIIHRDVKPDNILLDHNYTARVSDFGGSRLVPLDITQKSTKLFGTYGYIDPEYFKKNYLTEKSDVYSFGVVPVELLTGKKAMGYRDPNDDRILAVYFMDKFKENLLSAILDVNIEPRRNMEQISQVAGIAIRCLQEKGEDRPNMKDVATQLEGLIVAGNHEENVVNESSNGNGRVVSPPAIARDQGTGSEIVECDTAANDSLMITGGR